MLLQYLHEFRRYAGVGYDKAEIVERAGVDQRRPAEFAGVGQQDRHAGPAENELFREGFSGIGRRDAGGRETDGAEKRFADMERFADRCGQRADQRARKRAEFAAEQDQPVTRLHELGRRHQGIGHDREVAAAPEFARQREYGAAAVEIDRVAVFDKGEGGFGDTLLFGGAERGFLVEQRFALFIVAADADRSAVHALNGAAVLEGVQIAPHRRLGDLERAGQFGDGAHSVAERRKNQVLALRRKQFPVVPIASHAYILSHFFTFASF